MSVTAIYPKVKYRSKPPGAVSNAGMLLLSETARVGGLVDALSVELDGFARPTAVHLPGKAICDLAGMFAAGVCQGCGRATARRGRCPRSATDSLLILMRP